MYAVNVYWQFSSTADSNSNCILQFFFSLVIIFGAEVAAGVLGYLNKDNVCIWPVAYKIYILLHIWTRLCLWFIYRHFLGFSVFFELLQVVGEIQGFYLNTLNDNNGNGTSITSMYHSIVSNPALWPLTSA